MTENEFYMLVKRYREALDNLDKEHNFDNYTLVRDLEARVDGAILRYEQEWDAAEAQWERQQMGSGW